MSKQKYYPLVKKAVFATDNVYEAAALSLIDRVEIGLITVDKKDGKYWATYTVNYPETMQDVIVQAHKQFRNLTLNVNVRHLGSKITYLIHLRKKEIKKYKLHKERNRSVNENILNN